MYLCFSFSFLSFFPGRLIAFVTLQLFCAPQIRMCASTQSSLTDFELRIEWNLLIFEHYFVFHTWLCFYLLLHWTIEFSIKEAWGKQKFSFFFLFFFHVLQLYPKSFWKDQKNKEMEQMLSIIYKFVGGREMQADLRQCSTLIDQITQVPSQVSMGKFQFQRNGCICVFACACCCCFPFTPIHDIYWLVFL